MSESFAATADRLVRAIPDWPEPGVVFRDITPLLADPVGLTRTVDALTAAIEPWGEVDTLVGIEARGFILAPPVAARKRVGFVAVRKAGKLPPPTVRCEYALEYATATIELSQQAISAGDRVVLVDDVLATGGTLAAARQLVESVGGRVIGAVVLIELPALGGRSHLEGLPLAALLEA